ncbi:MAG TPA: hypothetical protein VK427_20305 [Kofleriaceae bacterium]|nr:hypothetical protein [Kofleriaceae bacterium]
MELAEGQNRIQQLTRIVQDGDEPIRALARRLNFGRRAEEFLSFVVACSADPVCAAELLRLQGQSSVHGAAITSYAAVSGADDDARELALALCADHPLTRHSILEAGSATSVTPALRVWAVSARVPLFLLGDERVSEPLLGVDVTGLLLYDEQQRGQLDDLARLLDERKDATIIVEGPQGSGRTTAVAMAARRFGRRVVCLPLERMGRSLDELDAGLRALRREVALTDAIPVIRGVDELDTPDDEPRRRRLEQFVTQSPVPTILTTALVGQAMRFSGELVRVQWEVPHPDARRNMWNILAASHQPAHQLDELALDQLGHRYSLAPGAMREALGSVLPRLERDG